MRSDQVPARTLRASPGQTVGPFFHLGLAYDRMHEVASPHSPGAILLSGRVLDGSGTPVPDALVEIWGADADGSTPRSRGSLRRDDHAFTGFGRACTTPDGRFAFWTRTPGAAHGRTPFFAAAVFARGLLDVLRTRIYVPDDPLTASDPFLASLEPDRRATLVASRTPDGDLQHDIRLQGPEETVFLAF